MDNSLATAQPNTVVNYSDEQIKVLTDTVARGATQTELDFFLAVCKRTGLDPFTKQVYFTKRKVWNSFKNGYDEVATIQTGIDGYRVIAARTGDHAGTDDAIFFNGKGEVSETDSVPFKAKVAVYRMVKGKKIAFEASARWDEYCQRGKDQKPSNLWAKMPYLMLAKCAEALALRKAFPFELSGVYTKEEMMQADNSTDDEGKTFVAATEIKEGQAVYVLPSKATPEQVDRWKQFVQAYPESVGGVVNYLSTTYGVAGFEDLSETDAASILKMLDLKYPARPTGSETQPEPEKPPVAQPETLQETVAEAQPVQPTHHNNVDFTKMAMACPSADRAYEIMEMMDKEGAEDITVKTVKGILTGKFPELA